MRDPLDRTIQRTKQYWYIDGFYEIAIGGIFFLLALFFYIRYAGQPGSLLVAILDSSLVLVIIGVGLAGGYLVQFAKKRITYPRTGYVVYRQRSGWRWLTALAAFILASLLAFIYQSVPPQLAWQPLLSGLVIGAAWTFFGLRIRLTRFSLLGILSILLGVGLGFSGLDDTLALALFDGSMGLLSTISGGLTLKNYLDQTEPAEEEMDESRD